MLCISSIGENRKRRNSQPHLPLQLKGGLATYCNTLLVACLTTSPPARAQGVTSRYFKPCWGHSRRRFAVYTVKGEASGGLPLCLSAHPYMDYRVSQGPQGLLANRFELSSQGSHSWKSCYSLTQTSSVRMIWDNMKSFFPHIIPEITPLRIGHLGDSCIGQVSNLFLV